MTASWVSMGISTLWSPADAGPWSAAINNSLPGNPSSVYTRVGGNASLSQQSGKVVRGFRLRGQIDAPPISQAVFAALRGILQNELRLTLPSKQTLDSSHADPNSNPYGFDWHIDQTNLPIGIIPGELTDWFQVDAPGYAGLRSVQPSQLQPNGAGGGRIFRATPVALDILVSDRPVIQSSLSRSSIRVNETATLTVTIGYGGVADPIAGVAISVSAATGTAVSSNAVTFGGRAVMTTDQSGIARFTVKGIAGTPSPQALSIDLEDGDYTSYLSSSIGRTTAGESITPITTTAGFMRAMFSPQLPYGVQVSVNADPPPPRPGQCVTYPAIPDVPAVPSRTTVDNDFGWNAGANSIEAAPGDFELQFNEIPPGTVGSVIGIVASRQTPVSDYSRVTHGFYFSMTPGGASIFSVMEMGRVVTGNRLLNSPLAFRIQRVNGAVFYYWGQELIYASKVASLGEVVIGASLYATRDALPSTTPDGDCFWTQVLFAAQECGGGPPVDIAPIRTIYATANNGTVYSFYSECDDDFNCIPVAFGNGGEDRYIGIYKDGGAWKVLGGVRNYFPNSNTDRIDLVLNMYRQPRNTNMTDMGGYPQEFTDYAEFVGQFPADGLSIVQSNNGNLASIITGDAPNMPDIDPAYQYMLIANVSVFSAADELVYTENSVGAVLDFDGEVGDVPPILFDMSVEPVGYTPYTLNLRGFYPAYIEGENGAVIIYTVPTWSGQMADFLCGNFMASLNGQPPINIYGACS